MRNSDGEALSLFIVAGEVSGDNHAHPLLKALQEREPELCVRGLGGEKLAGDFPQVENWLEKAAVLGFWEVIQQYSYFKTKMAETVEAIITDPPSGVLLVDYPGFNLRLAAALRERGFSGKIISYVSPQVWAWKKGRIKTMARLLDVMICLFPFEVELYEKSGLPAKFCGHPLVDELVEWKASPPQRESSLIALLPGSRRKEIDALFDELLEGADLMRREDESLRFVTTAVTEELRHLLSMKISERGLDRVVTVETADCQHLMLRCAAGVVASGTATLEAALLGMPYVLVYKVSWLTAWVARRVLKIRFLGIVNVLAGREVVPELLQERLSGARIAAELQTLLHDRQTRERMLNDFQGIADSLGDPGTHDRVAGAVQEVLGS